MGEADSSKAKVGRAGLILTGGGARAAYQVGVLKASRGLPASDPGREEQQVARLRDLAHQADLDPVFAEKFLAFIVEEVIRHHEEIAQDHAARG